MNASDLHVLPLTDDDTLQRGLEVLLAPVVRHQMWILFLDDHDVLMNPLMPNDEVDIDPLAPLPNQDGDARPAAQAVADAFARVMDEFEIAQLVIVWERPGRKEIDARTRRWAQELGARFRAHGVRVRAQCLLSDRGLRVLRPDDLV